MNGPPRRLLGPAVKVLADDLVSGAHPTAGRAETLGVVVSRQRRDKYLRFLVDDGTGCAPCILWLNQRTQVWVPDPELAAEAEAAEASAEAVALGRVVGVRGRVTVFRGEAQVTVSEVWEETDPNAQILHWLDCIRLGRRMRRPPEEEVDVHAGGRKRKASALP